MKTPSVKVPSVTGGHVRVSSSSYEDVRVMYKVDLGIRNCVLETPVWISASFLLCALETDWVLGQFLAIYRNWVLTRWQGFRAVSYDL